MSKEYYQVLNYTDQALYWYKDEFCVSFRKYREYDPEFDDIDKTPYNGDPSFMRCTAPHTEDGTLLGSNYGWCQESENYLYPIVFSISVIFLIITLLVYIAEDSLRFVQLVIGNVGIIRVVIIFRKQKLFSHILMSYLTTLIIGYIFRLVELGKTEKDQGTVGCKIKGYFSQYFYLVSNNIKYKSLTFVIENNNLTIGYVLLGQCQFLQHLE